MIATARLLIKPFTERDAEAFFELSQDSGFNLHPITVYTQKNVEAAKVWVKTTSLWGVWERGSGLLIGITGLREMGADRRMEVTYRFKQSAWGKGFATEAADAVVDYAFYSLGFAEVAASITAENLESKKVAAKLGMKFSGTDVLFGKTAEIYKVQRPSVDIATFKEEHLTSLRRWLQKDHIKPVWQEPEDELKLRQKYLEELPLRGVRPFVFLIDGKLSGYIQYYCAFKIGGGWWENEHKGTYGIDLMIGEESALHRGLGLKVLRKFIWDLQKSLPDLSSFIIDPAPENARAINTFKKAGFRVEKEIETPGGAAVLMRLRA